MTPSTPLSNLPALWRCALPVVLAVGLSACGGGGGDAGTPQPPAGPDLQGFWASPAGATTGASAVILDSGEAWIVLLSQPAGATAPTTTGFANATLTSNLNDFSGTGSFFRFADNTVQAFSASGSKPGSASLQASFTIAGQPLSTLALSANASYTTPAKLADITGRWNAGFDSGAVKATLDIAANGALTGSSTTGCTYAGTLAPHGNVAVFDLAITETCQGKTVPMAGIATINAAKTTLFLGYANTTRTTGAILIGQR